MAEPLASPLLRLMVWLSPAFPVGSFSYSHGLERAVHDELVGDATALQDWIGTLLDCGSARNDAVLFAETWRRAQAGEELDGLCELAEALAGCRERHLESMLQGAAFLRAASAWDLPKLPQDCAYCVAVGAAAGRHGIPLHDALAPWLQAFASNHVQAAIRLGIVGQTDGVSILARLEPAILEAATRAARSTLGDLGSATVLAEVAAMNHETQYSRLFRS